MSKLKFLICLFPLLAGCYKATFVNAGGGGSPGKTETIWVNTLLWGLVSLNTVDVKAVCGDAGAFKLQTNTNLWSMLLSGVTAGIYSPVMAHVTCKS